MATAAACCPSVLYANTWAASNFEGDMTTANSGPVFVVDAQPFVVGSPCGAAIEVTAFVATASNYNLFDPPPLDHYPLSWYLILAVVDVATDDLVLFSGDVDSCPFQQPGGGPIFGVYPASTWARVAGVLPPGAYELTCFYACEAPTAATGTPVLFSWQVDVGAVLWTGPPGTWGSGPADGASALPLTAPPPPRSGAAEFTSALCHEEWRVADHRVTCSKKGAAAGSALSAVPSTTSLASMHTVPSAASLASLASGVDSEGVSDGADGEELDEEKLREKQVRGWREERGVLARCTEAALRAGYCLPGATER